ncbi:MAG: hypothetical protein QXV21_00805 [Candidatus Bathyarchaeia archaeon]
MVKLETKPKLSPEIERPLEEIGICCYCGFSWILRYSPKHCPHCFSPIFKTKFPDGSIYNPATGGWSR